MRKPTVFAYINAKTKSQIRCAVHATTQLISAYVFATEIVFSQRGSYSIIMISIHFKREKLSACIQCVGMGKLGWVKAIHRLKCNHAGCFYFQLYEYYAFLAFI